jgi:hypothetical protein
MNLFSFHHTHFHIHVNTPEEAAMITKIWKPKTGVKELNEQKTVENTDKKPTEKEETND